MILTLVARQVNRYNKVSGQAFNDLLKSEFVFLHRIVLDQRAE